MPVNRKWSIGILMLTLLACALVPKLNGSQPTTQAATQTVQPNKVKGKELTLDPAEDFKETWLTSIPRGQRKGFSIYGIRPGDNIQEVQLATKAPLEFRLQGEGLAEIYHPIRHSLLSISYQAKNGAIQAVDIHQKLSFERDGEPVRFSEDSYEGCKLAIAKWVHPNRPNVGLDGENELIVYPIAPGGHIGFISLVAKGNG